MAEDYVRSQALKTVRGMQGNIREGRAAGGISYGYRVHHRVGEDGKIVRGHREVDLEQAEVVRRIYNGTRRAGVRAGLRVSSMRKGSRRQGAESGKL